MSKTKLPSAAQAKLIARVWATGETCTKSATYVDPTVEACIKRGWLVWNTETGKHPNGAEYRVYGLHPSGVYALECFLCQSRVDRAA